MEGQLRRSQASTCLPFQTAARRRCEAEPCARLRCKVRGSGLKATAKHEPNRVLSSHHRLDCNHIMDREKVVRLGKMQTLLRRRYTYLPRHHGSWALPNPGKDMERSATG